MKLKQFAKNINELLEKYPNAIVVYASDGEGNHFNEVFYEPSPGYIEENEFTHEHYLVKTKVNAICIN